MKTIFRLCSILMLFICFSCGLFKRKESNISPEPQGMIVTVKDKKGNPIQNIEVTVSAANIPLTKPTDSRGEARFEGLGIGNYKVSVESDEYESQEKLDIAVAVGKPTPVVFELDFKFPLFFEPILNFSTSNEISKSLIFENKNSKKNVTLFIKIPDNEKSWLSSSKTELKLLPNTKEDVTFIINPKGKESKNYVSNVILNYSTDAGQSGSSTLTVSMFIPNPQAPIIKTYDVTGIAQNSADVTGNIINAGGGIITTRGFCWSENPSPNPDIDKTIKTAGGNVGEFTETIEGLEKGKTYYVRAFAINGFGMGLGDVKKFTTSNQPSKPTIIVNYKNIFPDKLSLIGKITSNGGGIIKEYGFVWNISGEPKITDNKLEIAKLNADNSTYDGDISGLKPETEYKVRAYAINDIGGDNVGYSQTISLKTSALDLSPKINSFLPEQSTFGKTITINGTNFGTDTSKIKVFFYNNRRAVIENLTDTQLKVMVPIGATTGPIKVQLTGQPTAQSTKNFTYILTPYISTIANIPTTYFINDISQVCNGNIYFSAVNINHTSSKPYPINNSGVFRLNRDNSVTKIIDNDAGNTDGAINIAKFINPTEITCVNNDVYIADQYDNSVYKSNSSSGYSNIRKISNGLVSTVFRNSLTTKEFIHEMTYISQLNSILYTNGTFYKYDFVNPPSVALTYDGLTTAMGTDEKDVYTLDLSPENNPTKWTLNKRKSNPLNSLEPIISQNLITPSVYPIGMALDAKRGFAYVVERNKKNNFNIYRIRLSTQKAEIIYDGSVNTNQSDGNLDGIAKFYSISCIAFDTSRDALIIVDADSRSRNNVRILEYR